MQELIQHFEEFFEIVPADTPQLIQASLNLRYQIFCNEKGYFDVSNSQHLEKDQYDARSVHCLLRHKPTGDFAATVRLILPDYFNDEFGYPLEEQLIDVNQEEARFLASIPRRQLAEISRFSVCKAFRRRVGEQEIVHGISQRFGQSARFKGRRFDSYITLGLFKAIVNMSAQHQIRYWCAFMEPSLIRLLTRVGIEFKPIGKMVNYYGERLTCYEQAYKVLQGIKETKPEVWEFITDDGKHMLDVHT